MHRSATQTTCGEMEHIIAIVQGILIGAHGEFVVTTARGIPGSITFSLSPDVWHEESRPQQGIKVVVSDLRKKRAGWRAYHARYMRPSDQQQPKR
jgi:hypothetical protein